MEAFYNLSFRRIVGEPQKAGDRFVRCGVGARCFRVSISAQPPAHLPVKRTGIDPLTPYIAYG